MKQFKRTLVTAALPYANGPVHIGHLAGVYIPADIYARYLRLRGKEVIFVGGSDEHGVPITLKARKEGVTPRDIVNRYHEMIKKSLADLGISFDIYSRTSSETHRETSSAFFKKLHDEGKFVQRSTMQFYDEQAGQFLADRYITGTCPRCGNPRAYGDQCEACGTSLNATDLINPVSAITGNAPGLKETTHWYLPLDEYEPWLRQWILEEHTEWRPTVYGQCKSWLDTGLQARAVTRDLEWGVPVPVEGAEGKVLYVWFDAPIGYISATKELTPAWETYWKDPSTRLVHFIGKDNIVFHCIIFPAMLKAEGSYILPDNVPANEFLNLEGEKISTTRDWAVWLHEYLVDFKDKQDVLRYVLAATAPETKDNDFTWKDFQARNNNELVAAYGNFVNRALVLTRKYFDNRVPARGELAPRDTELLDAIPRLAGQVGKSIEGFHFREAVGIAMNLARLGNKYLQDTEPWKIFATDPARVATVLNVCLQVTANLATLMEPFMPFSSDRLRGFMNITPVPWNSMGDNVVDPGHLLGASGLLFEKIEDDAIRAQVDRLEDKKRRNAAGQPATAPEAAEPKPLVPYPHFAALDIRVGTIIAAEKVAKTDKLLKLTVDLGTETRVIVSGIAAHYTPAEIVGRRVSVLLNLEPRTLKGIESRGMILTAEGADGTLALVAPERPLPPGAVVC
ncbi:MAG: methionine--tRNA ligase [Odoribacteraceae bacterium]|jgi:methionyl-tRNA synthetase|nr:methionine--tRNA ligase [Odoribacteraceae bacterium]